MRRLMVWVLAAFLAVGSATAVSGCKRRKKHKKWKKHKRWKKKHRYKDKYRDKHKKAARTTLRDFLGDSTDLYFAGAPIRVGFSSGQVANILGLKGKKKFKTPQGKISVKANYGPDGKVAEVKANLEMSLGAVLPLAKAKWGPPAKSEAQKHKWEKAGLKIIVKLKEGKVKISIKKGTGGATGPPIKGKLEDLLGDKKDVYLKAFPIKLGQAKAEAVKVVGPTGKKLIETEKNGGGLIKVTFSDDNKVEEIKLKLEAKLDVVMKLAKAKWGKPKKKDKDRTSWEIKKVKVIIKVKDGKTIIAMMDKDREEPALKKEI